MARASDAPPAAPTGTAPTGTADPDDLPPSQLDLRTVPWVKLGLILVAIIAVVVAASIALGSVVSQDRVRGWIDGAGPWAIVVSQGLMLTHTFLPFPAEILTFANSVAFGPWEGLLLTETGWLATAVLGHVAGRYAGRPVLQRFFSEQQIDAVGNEIRGRRQVTGLLLIRLIPFFPWSIVNLTAGMLRVPLGVFMWTTVVGMLPQTLIVTFAPDFISQITGAFT